MVGARSLAHAVRGEFGPRLRVSRTVDGGRAMVYDGGAPRRPAVAPADDAADPLAPVQPPSGLAGGRFIDDGDEVGFRRGIYRAAREGYDVFAVDPERAERLSAIAPTETFQVPGPDGPVDRVGFRITPELRTRLTAGEARFRYGPADGEAQPAGDRWMDFVPEDRAPSDGFEYRTNAEGWRQLLPYRDKWGDPANDEGDRGAALARLQEIGSTDWRAAEWDDVLRAHDDVEEVIAQLYFYRPDISMERAAALDGSSTERGSDMRFFGGEVRAYMHEREKGQPFGGPEMRDRWSMLSPQGQRGPVVAEIGDAAREAIEAISKRAGAMDLLRGWSRSADARRDRIPAEREPDRAGFVSAVRRAIEGLPDSAFQRDPLALYNTIRKQPNVTGEELDFMDFAQRLMAQGSRHRWTRPELLKLVDDHGLRMVRRNNEFDPRLPTRNYNNGGTRAFDGPRVPGPGRYFEERFAFPRRTRGGKKIEPMEGSHWEDGVWGSVRGSVREVEGYGKGILGEELQRDPYQHIASGRTKVVPPGEVPKVKADLAQQRRLVGDASYQGFVIEQAAHRLGLADKEDLGTRTLSLAIENGDLSVAARVLARIEEAAAPARARMRADEAAGALAGPADFARQAADDAVAAFNVARDLIARHPGYFNPEARKRLETDVVGTPPMSDSQSVRMLIRSLFTRAAREQADWVAIPTGQLNDRIQANTFNSAGHFYDGAARDVLGKVARAIGGDALTVERVILPTPPLRRGVPVYMVRGLTPAMRLKIREGLPMFGAAERLPTSRMSVEDVEGEVRNAWGPVGAALLDSETIQVVNDPWDLRHVFDDEDIGQIPSWVGAVHDYNTNKTFLFSDRIAPGRARLLVLHEIGVHHGLQEMVGKKRYGALIREAKARVKLARDRIQKAIDAGVTDISDRRIDPTDVFWASADARVRKAYESNDPAYGDELLAYASEDAEAAFGSLPEAHPDRTWWQGILDAIRRWMVTSFAPGGAVRKAGEAVLGAVGEAGNLTPRDLHTLAVASLQRVARSRQAEAGPVGAVDGGRVLRYARDRGFEGEDAVVAAQWLDDQGYFSPALEAARRYPQDKSTREQMVGWLQNQPRVKQDEIRALMLDEFVAVGGPATREDLLSWVRAHRYSTSISWRDAESQVREGGPGNAPEYGAYTYLSRAENNPNHTDPPGYFEAVIMPRHDQPGADFEGGHLTGGGLAHVRGSMDTSIAGKRSALLIELQSDLFDAPKDSFVDAAAIRAAQRRATGLVREISEEADGWVVFEPRNPHGLYDTPVVPAFNEPRDSILRASVYGLDESGLERRLAGLAPERRKPVIEKILEYNQLTRRLETEETLARTTDIPFRTTWPEKAFTDVVRNLISRGVQRISWSTKEAVNAIPGMSGYEGTLYDERLPRYAARWLGVEPKKGSVDDAELTMNGEKLDAYLRDAVSLSIEDSRPGSIHQDDPGAVFMEDFFMEQALNEDFFSEVYNGRMSAEDSTRLMVSQLKNEIDNDVDWDPEIMPDFGEVSAWVQSFVHRAVAETEAIRDTDNSLPTEVSAWYFDVTPEVQARALAPRSMFFGPADSGQPPRDLSALLNGGAGGGGLGPARIRAAGPDDEASPGAAIDDVIRRASEMSQQRIRDGKIVTVMDGEIDALTQGVQRLPPDAQEAALAQIGAKYHEDVVDEVRHRAGIDQPVIEGEVAAPAAAPAAKPKRERRRLGNPDDTLRDAAGDGADYRRGPGGSRGPRAAGLGEMVAGNALGASVGGVITAVAMLEQGREERRAEFERLDEERRKSEANRDENDERTAELEQLAEAVRTGDWAQLPELDPALLEDGPENLKGRTAYVRELADIVEAATGMPAEFTFELIARETAYTFRPDIRPIDRSGRQLSSAVGFGQFIDSTYVTELLRSGGELGLDVEGLSKADVSSNPEMMALREDPRFAALLVGWHTRRNVEFLSERLDRDVTTAEAYAAHFLGADRAVQFLRDVEGDLDARAMERRYAREATSNPWVFKPGGRWRSAREVMAELTQEFGNDVIDLPGDSADGGEGAAAGSDE